MRENKVALVLGLGTNGLGIVRSLAREKIKIIGFYNNNREIGRFSRYCKSIRCPSPDDEENLLQFLIEFGSKLKTRAVLFAENDIYILFMAKNEEVLRKYFLFATPERNSLEKIIDKKKFYRTCEELGIQYPKTYYFDNDEELLRISLEIKYPCIIKPAYTQYFIEKFAKKVLFVESKEDLFAACRKINTMYDKVMLQEIISGGDEAIYFCGAYLGADCQPRGISLGRKIRQNSKFGVTTLAESINDECLLNIAVSVLQKFKYKGLCDIEFKKDPIDNQYKIIEINARTGLWHMLCTESGVNLCAIAFHDLSNHEQSNLALNRRSIKWMNEICDSVVAFKKYRNGELSILEWIESIRGAKSFALMNVTDPVPLIAESIYVIKNTVTTKINNRKTQNVSS